MTGQIKNLQVGNIISFGGYDWEIINPSTGYIIMVNSVANIAFDSNATKVFNPSDSNNVGYYLNTTFYQSIPSGERNLIKNTSWTIGSETNESASTVTSKIGLISKSEYSANPSFYGYLSNWYWTRTPSASNPNDVWGIWIGWSGPGTINADYNGLVRPVLYIDPNAYVVNGVVVLNQPPNISVTNSNPTL